MDKGKANSAEQWWIRSLEVGEEIGQMRYYIGLTHLEVGKRLNDLEHLKKAEVIFAEIGANFDRRARKLLQPNAERNTRMTTQSIMNKGNLCADQHGAGLLRYGNPFLPSLD